MGEILGNTFLSFFERGGESQLQPDTCQGVQLGVAKLTSQPNLVHPLLFEGGGGWREWTLDMGGGELTS